ncbi:hypothetical protein [Neolewinella persica]|uniref:hypothetical protein n=1 Tax=Neolewinella persica TaxID=70998 RepID=UPI00037C0780|nr:hypothetical protein [Neolewinella persica]
MKYFSFLLGCLFLSCSLSAQYIWDGGGDGTSWNDALNWDRDEVPATDSMVVFSVDATVTGTAPNNPVSVRINSQANVILDMDLTVGNGNTAEHAITFGDTCSLVIGASGTMRTIVANTTNNKHGMVIFGGSEMVNITVSEGSTFELVSGVSGINLANANSTITNNGSIILREGLKDGVRVVGTFINNGTVTGDALERDLFNVKDGGVLNNSSTGMIISDQPGDDGIDLITGASFLNDGTLMLTAKDNASSGNNAIVVGNPTSAANFVNNSTSVVLNGGGGDGDLSGRTLSIDTLGLMTNNGVITISGGAEGSRLYVKGNATNAVNGTIDLTDGRFNVSTAGTFTNNGLVKTTREGSGGFVTGVAVNNAFFDYTRSNQFAAGSMGIIVDMGFSLNNNDVRVNAMGACTVDLVNAPYEWFLNGMSYATASDTGAFTFAPMSLIADSVMLTTTIPGVEIKVVNVCQEAVQTNGVFSPAVRAVDLRAYPNPIRRDEAIKLDLSGFRTESISFRVVNAFGQNYGTYQLIGGGTATLSPAGWSPGTYLISSVSTKRRFVARVVVLE